MIRKAIATALAIGLFPGAAAARPSTVEMSCDQARAVVVRSGGIVLGTGGPTDRFVRDASFCQATEIGRPAFVPTRDTRNALWAIPATSRGRATGSATEIQMKTPRPLPGRP